MKEIRGSFLSLRTCRGLGWGSRWNMCSCEKKARSLDLRCNIKPEFVLKWFESNHTRRGCVAFRTISRYCALYAGRGSATNNKSTHGCRNRAVKKCFSTAWRKDKTSRKVWMIPSSYVIQSIFYINQFCNRKQVYEY